MYCFGVCKNGSETFWLFRRLLSTQARPRGRVAEVYVKEGVDFSKYAKLMLDQVIFALREGLTQR
jgi:hypothetical protein